MRNRPSILLVEDDADIARMLRHNLTRDGFIVRVESNGEDALIAIDEECPDLAILDWMLPAVSGLEVCRRLRRSERTRTLPILMLTARAEAEDTVRGLDSGADDYVPKPFSPRELSARIRALLRRVRPAFGKTRLECGDIAMDLETYRVWRGERQVRLGPTEFRMLRHFLEHPRRVFSREQLLDSVWGRDIAIEPRTVDVHIRRLRKALNDADDFDVIRTVRSAGYALEAAPDAAPAPA